MGSSPPFKEVEGGTKQPISDLSMRWPATLSASADVRSLDDVIAFEEPHRILRWCQVRMHGHRRGHHNHHRAAAARERRRRQSQVRWSGGGACKWPLSLLVRCGGLHKCRRNAQSAVQICIGRGACFGCILVSPIVYDMLVYRKLRRELV